MFVPNYLDQSNTFLVIIIDLDGKYLYANPYYQRRYSYIHSNFIGEDAASSVLAEDHPVLRKAIQAVLENPHQTHAVTLRKPSDKSLKSTHLSQWEFTAYYNESNDLAGFLCTGVEITLNQIQVDLLKQFPDNFFIVKRSGDILEFNIHPNSYRANQLGNQFATSKMIEDSILKLIPSEFQEAAQASFDLVFETGEANQFQFNLGEGSYRRNFEADLSLVSFMGSIRLLWVERDITLEKQEVIALEENMNKMKDIWESMTDMFFSFNANWEIEYANSSWEKYQGLTEEQYLGKSIWDIFTGMEETVFYEAYHKAMKNREVVQLEGYFASYQRWFSKNIYPSASGGLSVYTRDISDRKLLEEAEKHTDTKLKNAWERMIDGFILLDNSMNIVFENSAWRSLLGESRLTESNNIFERYPELKGHSIGEGIRSSLETKETKRIVDYLPDYDLWLSAVIYPSDDDLVVNIQDVSSREKMRNAISDLSFMTSHELRHEYAKLHSVINLLSVSNEDEKYLLKEAHKSLIQINSLISLMNDKLTFNRDNSGNKDAGEWMEFEEAILIDDDHVINFINARVIRLQFPDARVKSFVHAEKALAYLKEFDRTGKKLIFIDLNMPGFDGWDFLESYRHLQIKSPVYVLTSSINPKDIERSMEFDEVVKFMTKPLSSDLLESEKIRPQELKSEE